MELHYILNIHLILIYINSPVDENHCQLAEQPDLQSKISELTSAHAQLEQNQHETNKLIQDLTSDKENLTKHLQNTSETLKTLIENLKKHETLGPKLQNLPIEDPDSIPTALTQLIQIFQSETDTLTYKLHRAADYAEEQTAKLETQTQTSEELTHHHETKILNLIHQIQAFENERDSLIDNATQHKQQVTNATLELQKHQFACNNLAMENEELKIQLSLLNEQLSEKDQELSQLATEKMAAEESLSAKLENKPDDESLSILLRKFEKEAADREIRLKMALDDLEMEKVMRQSTSESEAGWIKKFEESNMLVSQLQLIIAESDEEKRRDKHLLEDMRVEYEETSGKLAHELGIYQEGEMRLREELGVLQARQFDDRKRIVDELAKLEETVEILSRDKEELQQKLEIDVKLKDEEIQELKLIQVEKLTDLRDKTSESVGCLKEKIEKQAEELEDLKLQVSGSKEKETEIKNGCQLEIETYEEQIKLLQVEKEDLLVKLSESCLESDNLKEARQILQLESQKMADEFEKSRKILEENGKNVCQMEIESYDKEIKLLQAEKEDLLVKFTECCRERENLKEQSRILLLESEKMADEFEKNRKLLEEKELKIKNGCQQEMESYEEQMKLLQAEKEDLLAKFTESCRERDDFKELSRVLQMDTNKLAGDYENCRKMLGVKELELNEFRFSVEGKDNQIEQLEKLKIELIDKCDKSRNEFDNEKECLIKEIEDVKRKNKAKWEQREKDWSEEMNGKMMDLKKKAEQKLSQIKVGLQVQLCCSNVSA
uniref:Uncharacterized protein n=1 Tax=Strigamia maritima TaxID=126957 RepID=T1IKK6_STRMM